MLKHLDELGIARGVLMSSGDKKSPIGNNHQNYKLCKKYPDRYSWMCNVDYGNPETVYDKLAECKSKGAIGVGELMINKPLSDPFLKTVFEAAEKLDMPVTFHMSPQEGFGYGVVDRPGLPLLEETLKEYPNCKILGHSQTFWIEMSADAPTTNEERNQWGQGPVVPGGRVPELFEKYDNLYGDLSANSGGCAIMRDPDFGLAFLEKYSHRLFFATDMVNKDMTFPLGAWLDEQVESKKLSQEAYDNICFKNAKRIFDIG